MLKRFEWLFWGVVLISLLLSCVPEKGSEDYLAPEILSAEAIVADRSVSLSCELSSPRVQTCGFVFWTGNQEKKIITCDLPSTSFRAVISDLSPGMTYEWYAFANAGEIEIHSDTRRFATMEIIPEVKGIDIPDPYFKQYLLDNFDANGDGILSEMEGLIIRKIDVVTDKISSMRGIEHFKNLDSLICRGADVNEYDDVGHPGLLDSLDVSGNRKLRYLACDKNMLRSLIISDNPFLEEVLCSYNLLETIDLSSVPRLRELRMWVNNVGSLDFSNTPLLHTLECGGNPITSIDVSKCPRLGVLNVGDLRIKELDLSGNPKLGWLGIYGTDITTIDLSNNPNLDCLNCQDLSIAELDLSSCVNLYELKCWNCRLEELDVSMLPRLKILECSPMPGTTGKNLLRKLYVSEDQEIQGVTVNRSTKNVPEDTEIVPIKAGTVIIPDQAFKAWLVSRFDVDLDGEISFMEAADIHEIDFWSNQLGVTSLRGIEHMPELEILRCPGEWVGTVVLNKEHYYLSKHYHWDECVGPVGTLMQVDVSRNPKLRVLDLSNNSGIGETGSGTLDLSGNPLLEELSLQMCYIKYPDISCCPALRVINFSHGRGDMPDFSGFGELRFLDVSHDNSGRLQPVDVSGSPYLEEINVDASASSLSDLSNNPKLKVLKISWCADIHPDLSAVPLLEEYESMSCGLHSIDVSGLKNLKSLAVSGNPLGSLDLSSISGLERLVCNSCGLTELDIKGVKNLEYLECSWNSIGSIDFKACPNLSEVYVAGNPLKSMDLTSNRKLFKLFCEHTGLSELDVSHNPVLWDLRCDHNSLTSIDVSSNPKLWGLYCSDNSITELNLSNNREIQELDCSSNQIESLDVSSCPLLRWLICGNNQIRSLDVFANPHLSGTNGDDITGLFCSPMNDRDGNNLLDTLYVAKGKVIHGVTVSRASDHVPVGTKIVAR
jgi:hypothetical protein